MTTAATNPGASQRGPASFSPGAVRLLDSDFKRAQGTSVRYVLALDVDRLCAPYLLEAGLQTMATPYGSWESEGMGGHIGGHYLSACARLYAATGSRELLAKVRTVVGIMAACQEAAGDGYVGGVPRGRELGKQLSRGEVDADLFTLNGRWVPLYNLHKTLAGLLDAHLFAQSREALTVAAGLGDWWLGISGCLGPEAFEEVLLTEYGGMNDAFTLLWQATGQEKYLSEARRFAHRSFLEPLAAGQDLLDGLHANTQIPKVVGYARLAAATGDPEYARASNTFWDSMVSRRTVSIGGNSVREHFHPSSGFTPMAVDPQGPETCNTYNMLKLARLRFEDSGDPAAVDFYERATYNHILSSQHPVTGGLVYFTPMRPRHFRVYSRAQESMWCCVGSGLENHARYGELIYSHAGGDLLVNLYIPSTLDWPERGLRIRLETGIPRSDLATLHITADEPVEATVRLRRPGWATEMRVDGGLPDCGADGYVRVTRTWRGTSEVSVLLAPGFRAEKFPDGTPWTSFLYGPVVLAAREGLAGVAGFEAADERMGHVAGGPLLPLAEAAVVPDPGAITLRDQAALTAVLPVVGADGGSRTVVLEPFHGIHDERYTVYWPSGDSAARHGELRALDAAAAAAGQVVDGVSAGEQQPEADHGFTGEGSRAGGSEGIHWRNATGWFSYVLKDPDRRAGVLRVCFRVHEGRGHELRLNDALLPEPAGERLGEDQQVSQYVISDSQRSATPDGTFTFTVQALPGLRTGDLLSVQLLAAPGP